MATLTHVPVRTLPELDETKGVSHSKLTFLQGSEASQFTRRSCSRSGSSAVPPFMLPPVPGRTDSIPHVLIPSHIRWSVIDHQHTAQHPFQMDAHSFRNHTEEAAV